jgi:hypothetical protein
MTGVTAIMAGGRSFSPLAVVASNVSRAGFGPAEVGSLTTVASPNTTITKGVAPYTQVWTRVSGATPTISSSTALNPTWSDTVGTGIPNVSTWRVTATDAVGATAFYDIQVTLIWEQV